MPFNPSDPLNKLQQLGANEKDHQEENQAQHPADELKCHGQICLLAGRYRCAKVIKSDQKCGSLQPQSAPGCPYIPCHRSKTPMGLTSLDTVLKLGRIIETPEASTGLKLNTYPLVTKHHQTAGEIPSPPSIK